MRFGGTHAGSTLIWHNRHFGRPAPLRRHGPPHPHPSEAEYLAQGFADRGGDMADEAVREGESHVE